jgi:hypothetical protein
VTERNVQVPRHRCRCCASRPATANPLKYAEARQASGLVVRHIPRLAFDRLRAVAQLTGGFIVRVHPLLEPLDAPSDAADAVTFGAKISTDSNTISQCQILNEPIYFSRNCYLHSELLAMHQSCQFGHMGKKRRSGV